MSKTSAAKNWLKRSLGTPQSTGVDPEIHQSGHSSSVEMTKSSGSIEIGLSKQAIETEVKAFEEVHRLDPNMPDKVLGDAKHALETGDGQAEVEIVDGLLFEDSPYPEVRASVPPTDNSELPTNTVRVWVLGMIFVTLGSGLNMLFSMRSPSIVISAIVAQLLSYWAGKAWEKCMPTRVFTTFGKKWSLNPGKFNIKEHTVITIMSNVSFGGGQAYATSIIIAQQHYYGQYLGWGFQILLVWSTQIIGYGLAGAARKYLVWPASMIWPSNLVNCALFHTLHKDVEPEVPGWRIGRFKWFMCIFTGSFCWYWFPGYIAPFLSVFAFVTWIKPNNVVVNQLFGGFTGLSLIPITFDWTQIAGYVGSPLIPPWYAIANIFGGTVILYVILGSITHYSGAWYAAYLPISDSSSYDNMQNAYNVTRVLTSDFTLDVAKYKAYSPLFLSTTFSISYGISFATIAAVISHTILFHGKEMMLKFRNRGREEEDIHMRLMKVYPEVPNWWYYVVFVITVAISLAVTQAWPTHLTWWAFFIAIFIAILWFLPIGMIQATTNIQIGLNVITEFIIGYMQPGRPVAMMTFKTFGYITMAQGMSFVQDLKLGHYMKIPPKTLFYTQTAATVWASLVEVAVMNWALGSIKGVCTKAASDNFTCPQAKVFYTASVVWGLLGPARIFSVGQIYDNLLWFFLIGLLSPIPFWYMARRRPQSWWKYVNMPVFFGGSGLIPPATPLNYLSYSIVGYIFQSRIKGRHPAWWAKYNYVLSAGLDSGLAICTILIFLTLSLTNVNGGLFPSWWGVTIASTTLDASDGAIQKVLEAGQTFGPAAGTWS